MYVHSGATVVSLLAEFKVVAVVAWIVADVKAHMVSCLMICAATNGFELLWNVACVCGVKCAGYEADDFDYACPRRGRRDNGALRLIRA